MDFKEDRSIENDELSLVDLISDVKRNNIVIPVFQRDFVWSPEKVAKLFDSILKCYPIGSFILWGTSVTSTFRSISDNPKKGKKQLSKMILDGQQRITSIWYGYNGKEIDGYQYNKIFVNLKATDEEEIVFYDKNYLIQEDVIPLAEFVMYSAALGGEQSDSSRRIDILKQRLDDYKFSLVNIYGTGENIATEIFTRLNVEGKRLTTFEILCAKHYRRDVFDLRDKREKQKVKQASRFFPFEDKTILMALSVCVTDSYDCKESTILSIDSDTFIDAWDKVDKAFDTAIDYLKRTFLIPSSNYLPYQNLIIPFVWYFYHTDKELTIDAKKIMEDYFWRVSLSQSFVQAVAGHLAMDIRNIMKPLAEGTIPDTSHLGRVDISSKYIEDNGRYNKKSAFCKSFLCLLATYQPKSFEDNSLIILDGSELDSSNTKNNHHFFPKKYMKVSHPEINRFLVDHVANIVLVGSAKNKWNYRDLAPKEYLKNIRKDNPDFENTCKSHLIQDSDLFGIWNDDYNSFFQERIKLFQNAFLRRLIIKDSDIVSDYQVLSEEDVNDDETEIRRASGYHIETDLDENKRLQDKFVSFMEVKYHTSFKPVSPKSNLLYVNEDASIAFYIAVSKRYEERSKDYYYGPRKNRMDELLGLGAKNTFAILAGLNPDCALSIPFNVFLDLLKLCSITPSKKKEGEISHWHVNVKMDGGHAEWIVPHKENIDISKYLL